MKKEVEETGAAAWGPFTVELKAKAIEGRLVCPPNMPVGRGGSGFGYRHLGSVLKREFGTHQAMPCITPASGRPSNILLACRRASSRERIPAADRARRSG